MLIRHPDGNDLYETPEVATLSLLAVEPLPSRILCRVPPHPGHPMLRVFAQPYLYIPGVELESARPGFCR